MGSVVIAANDRDFKALERAFRAVEHAAEVLHQAVALDGEAQRMVLDGADRSLTDATAQLRRIVRLLLIRARADQQRRAKRIHARTAPLNWTPRTYERDRKFLRQRHRR